MRAALIACVASAACGRVAFAPHGVDAPPEEPPDAGQDAVAATGCANDPALVACYLFEGNASDGSPAHDDATQGAGIDYVPGVHGMAARFMPITSLLIPEQPSLNPAAVTFQAWIRLDASVPVGTRMGIVDNNNEWGLFVLPDLSLDCRTSSSSVDVGGGSIAVGVWTHVACTQDASTVGAWIDGILIQSKPAPGPVSQAGTMGARIGGNLPDSGSTADDGLVGAIDDLEIWSTVRSAADLCSDAGSC